LGQGIFDSPAKYNCVKRLFAKKHFSARKRRKTEEVVSRQEGVLTFSKNSVLDNEQLAVGASMDPGLKRCCRKWGRVEMQVASRISKNFSPNSPNHARHKSEKTGENREGKNVNTRPRSTERGGEKGPQERRGQVPPISPTSSQT